MGGEILIKQLEYVNERMKEVDHLMLHISEMPAPWPGMAEPRNRAVSALKVTFDNLILYQRALINRVGPKDEEPGELSSKVMEEVAQPKVGKP